MDKYIGFDIDSKKTVACVVQKGQKDRFTTLKTDIELMKKFLQQQHKLGEKLHLTFEIGGEAGYRYDALADLVDDITVSNPTKMTWIYRTSKKNDRIDARKQAILLSIGEVPGAKKWLAGLVWWGVRFFSVRGRLFVIGYRYESAECENC